MPIYEFECKCGYQFEELVISANDIVACPNCGGWELTRLMSKPAPARIVDFSINPDKGGRFRVDDATFHPSVRDPLPWDKGKGIKVYDMEFGKAEKDRLAAKSQMDNI